MLRNQPHISGLEVLTSLSSGGMGDILLARKRGTGGFEKLFAVKLINVQLAKRASIRAMFLDEARLVAQLDHPTIAQVYDFGETEENLYLAMEYVPGVPLNLLLRKGPVPPLVAARIAAEVSRGLHAAHELTSLTGEFLEVVHRDISPGNIILNFDGRIKILDFGIAFMKQRESPDTAHGERKGKPSYMAPEQLQGQRVDRRSDIYSLSVVLYELLTGRKLFKRSSEAETAIAIIEREFIAPPSKFVELPPGLDQITMRGLAQYPADRFANARQLANELEALIAREKGVSLEAYAEEALYSERREHRLWLQRVLSGKPSEGAFWIRAKVSPNQASPQAGQSAPPLLEESTNISSPGSLTPSPSQGPSTRSERLASGEYELGSEDAPPSRATTVAARPSARAGLPPSPHPIQEPAGTPSIGTRASPSSNLEVGSHQSPQFAPDSEGSFDEIDEMAETVATIHGANLRGLIADAAENADTIAPISEDISVDSLELALSQASQANLATRVLSNTNVPQKTKSHWLIATLLLAVVVSIVLWFAVSWGLRYLATQAHAQTDVGYTIPKPSFQGASSTAHFNQRILRPKLSSAQLQPGWLSIGAEAHARVRVNGDPIGMTPIIRYPLPQGEYMVELISPKSDRIVHQEHVKILTGQAYRIAHSEP